MSDLTEEQKESIISLMSGEDLEVCVGGSVEFVPSDKKIPDSEKIKCIAERGDHYRRKPKPKRVPFEIEDYYCGMVLIEGDEDHRFLITDMSINDEKIHFNGSWTDINDDYMRSLNQYHPEYKSITTLTKEKK